MKLYKLPNLPAGHRWLSHKTGLRDFEEVETPREGRQGMADFLNANELEVFVKPDNNDHDPIVEAERRAIEARSIEREQRVSQDWDAATITEFILDRASVAQCESIFAALGTRFKELAKGG